MKKLINFIAKLGGLIAFGAAVYKLVKLIKKELDDKDISDYLEELMEEFEDDDDDYEDCDDCTCEDCTCDGKGSTMTAEDVILEKIYSETSENEEEHLEPSEADVIAEKIVYSNLAEDIRQSEEELEAAKEKVENVQDKGFRLARRRLNNRRK